MEAKVNWKGRLAFTATADTGFNVPLDAADSVGGEEGGFRPMELIAIGLAGCTAMDVVSILQKKRQEVTDFEVRVHAEQAEQHPHVFTRAAIEYFVTGRDISEDAVLRSIELSATRYCPAQSMLGQVMPIVLKYHIFEAEGEGDRRLVKSGVFSPVKDIV